MMSLAATIFGLVLLTEVVSWIGKAVLSNFCYELHQHVFNRSAVARHRQLKRDILTAKQELLQTSAQDQFARWAKLRRKVDKGLEDLEKLNSAQAASKGAYMLKFKAALWLLTSGAQLGVGWWYGREAVFYLPPGWFGPVGWWLALPFAPAGSVSCGVWQMACTRVLKLGERIVRDFIGEFTITKIVKLFVRNFFKGDWDGSVEAERPETAKGKAKGKAKAKGGE